MAGYFIYSLDTKRFQQLVDKPTKKQLKTLAEILSDGMDEMDDEWLAGDPMAGWPVDPAELTDVVRQRLAKPDWYGDLSETGKQVWEAFVMQACDEALADDLGFNVESDGVYWDVIELARRHHNIPPENYSGEVLSEFGCRPFRFRPEAAERRMLEGWYPYHGMHFPDEVTRLIGELEIAWPAIEKSGDAGAVHDYENELMPALDKIKSEERILYVSVDT